VNIRIMSFEKHKDASLKHLELEYLKRLSKYCKIELQSFKRAKIKQTKRKDAILGSEAKLVREKLSPFDIFVVLDSKGKNLNSHELSQKLSHWQNQGSHSLVFCIGGPLGVGESLKKKADFVFSLSRLTFTHEMARMLLCETLYRSFDILNRGNYHK